MKKPIRALIGVLLITLALLGCTQQVPYTATSYLVLQNNPKYIPEVEVPLRAALAMAEDGEVDLSFLKDKIIDYLIDLADDPELAEHKVAIAYFLNEFKGLFVGLDFSIPEDYQTGLSRIKTFLEGCLEGLELAKLATT